MDKNGKETDLRQELEFNIDFINKDLIQSKSYNPNKGIKIDLQYLTNYREKYEISYNL